MVLDLTAAGDVLACVRDVDNFLDEYYLMSLPLPSTTALPTQINNCWSSYTPNIYMSTGFVSTSIFDDSYDVSIQKAENYAIPQEVF